MRSTEPNGMLVAAVGADAEAALGRIRDLAVQCRSAVGVGCRSSDENECSGDCGGHRATGWTLDPHQVVAALNDLEAALLNQRPRGLDNIEYARRIADRLYRDLWQRKQGRDATALHARVLIEKELDAMTAEVLGEGGDRRG